MSAISQKKSNAIRAILGKEKTIIGSSLPLLVGGGVTIHNVRTILPLVGGIIVACALKRGGVWWSEVETDRVKALMHGARAIHERSDGEARR